ncbi:gas vesicle protein [Streptomyces sp. NPDC048639]|uniref:gas vesicle protein GvpO n=1 Tax=Streptomyces sp. NPDC048639 TaxID=3365581 RepID=UPI003712279B
MPTAERKSSERKEGERASAAVAMRKAAQQLSELLGMVPDSISALKPNDDGWAVDVEVVEIERIPETTSVMATYHVLLDPGGELLGYERVRRYARGQLDRESRRG